MLLFVSTVLISLINTFIVQSHLMTGDLMELLRHGSPAKYITRWILIDLLSDECVQLTLWRAAAFSL